MAAENLVIGVDQSLHLLDLDEDVRGVASETARALVDHDPAVWKRVALARRAGGEKDGRHAGRHADADRADRGPHILHGVVDGQAARDNATRRVDVEADIT